MCAFRKAQKATILARGIIFSKPVVSVLYLYFLKRLQKFSILKMDMKYAFFRLILRPLIYTINYIRDKIRSTSKIKGCRPIL